MNLSNPIQPILANPKGVDINIEALRASMEKLTWLERSFGRAVALYETNQDNSIARVPKVPLGKGEYFTAMPNDTQKAFSFFYPTGPLEAIGEQIPHAIQQYYTQRVDLYVWANLKLIDSSNLGLGELLKAQVITLLNKESGTVLNKVWSDDIREVYKGWKIDYLGRDLLYYPFYAMRFELELTVEQNVCSRIFDKTFDKTFN